MAKSSLLRVAYNRLCVPHLTDMWWALRYGVRDVVRRDNGYRHQAPRFRACTPDLTYITKSINSDSESEES